MNPGVPFSSPFVASEYYEPPSPLPARHTAQATSNPPPLRSTGTIINEFGAELIDDGTQGCVQRNELIYSAMTHILPGMYVGLPVHGTRHDYVANFIGRDGAPREVYIRFHLDSAQHYSLTKASYRGPETQGELISAEVVNPQETASAPYSERNPARLALPPPPPRYDLIQAQRGAPDRQPSAPITPRPFPQDRPDEYGEFLGNLFDQMMAGSPSSRQDSQPPLNSMAASGFPHSGAVATCSQPPVSENIRNLASSPQVAVPRYTRRAARLPSATDDQMREHLRGADGLLRTFAQVSLSLRAVGFPVNQNRLLAMLRLAGGGRPQKRATGDQIVSYLPNADDSLKTGGEVANTFNTRRSGAPNTGVLPLPEAAVVSRQRRPRATR